MLYTNLRKLFFQSPSRPKDFYYSIRPLVIVSRCYGLLPFSFETNVYGEVHRTKVTIFDSIWFIVAIAMYFSCAFVVSMQIRLAPEYKSMIILLLAEQLLLVFGLVMCVVGIIMDMLNRDRILRNVQRFQSFDTEVEECVFARISHESLNV